MAITNNQIIGMMFANYGEERNDLRLRSYCFEFMDTDTELLKLGVRRWVRINTKMPTIADLYRSMDSIREEITGEKATLDWDEAWGEVQEAISLVGPYNKPEFSSPALAAAVNSFGWLNLCMTEEKTLSVVRAQLKNMFEAACNRQQSHQINQEVLGIGGEENKALSGRLRSLISRIGGKKGDVVNE